MMIFVVMKILMVITRGRDDSDEVKAVMIKNVSALMIRIRRKMLMIMFMLIAIMSNKNQPLKYLLDNGTLFGFFKKSYHKYIIEVDEEQIYIQNFA
jgi:hypothetical protein